jgi:hypothetical protein
MTQSNDLLSIFIGEKGALLNKCRTSYRHLMREAKMAIMRVKKCICGNDKKELLM